MTKEQFRYFQRSFFKHLTGSFNPVTLKITKISVDHQGDALNSFVGDGVRSEVETYELKALYKRMVSNKEREAYGVSADVSIVVYVSPLELEAQTGSKQFPEYFKRSYAGFQFEFLGNKFEVDRMIAKEEFFSGEELLCMAYQFDLKRDEGY
jgi:hypothetical protein